MSSFPKFRRVLFIGRHNSTLAILKQISGGLGSRRLTSLVVLGDVIVQPVDFMRGSSTSLFCQALDRLVKGLMV